MSIYEDLDIWTQWPDSDGLPPRQCFLDRLPALLCVSRQISQEAGASFYAKNRFTGYIGGISSFLDGIQESQKDMIAAISLTIGPREVLSNSKHSDCVLRKEKVAAFHYILTDLLDKFSAMEGLRTLTISIPPILQRHSQRIHLWLIEAGIMRLTGKIDLCVFSWKYLGETNDILVRTWSRAKGDTEWKQNDAPASHSRAISSSVRNFLGDPTYDFDLQKNKGLTG